MPDRLTPSQIRGARGMLDWSMVDLAQAARVSVSTVKRAECSMPQLVSDEAHLMVRDALEAAGLRFLSHPEGVGVIFESAQPRCDSDCHAG